MTPAAKATLFAVVAVLINWHYSFVSKTVDGNLKSQYSVDLSGAGFISIFCFFAVIFLARSLYRRVRRYLATGVTIPENIKFIEWSSLLILILLFVKVSSGITSVDGNTTTETTSGYGSDHAYSAFLLGSLFIVLLQINGNLAKWGKETGVPSTTDLGIARPA